MIILYGKLRKIFGKKLSCKVNSVQELVKAAEANRPGFTNYIEAGRGYIVRRGSEFRTAKDVGESEIEMSFSETTWHVLPMPMGASGTTRILLGAVIIAAAIAIPNMPAFYFTNAGAYTAFGVKAGALLMLSGVASVLAQSPTSSGSNSADEEPSYVFDGPTNRTVAGGAIPLAYGFEVIVGSTVVSGGLEIGDIV